MASNNHGFVHAHFMLNTLTICCRARAPCLMRVGANTMAPALEKTKAFIVRLIGKETGGKAQIRLPRPRAGAGFMGFSTQSSWTTDPLLLKGF